MTESFTGKIPIYQQYPYLYAYDSQTKNHLLKSGAIYRKRYAENPQRFIESTSMFPKPIPETPTLGIQHVPQQETKTVIGRPITTPGPTPEQLDEQKRQKETEEIRAQVQNILRDELRKNPDQYKNKNASDLSQAFRTMLIEKLSNVNQTIEKPIDITTKSKTSFDTYQKKWSFLLNKKSNEYDDEADDDEYDENDENDQNEI